MGGRKVQILYLKQVILEDLHTLMMVVDAVNVKRSLELANDINITVLDVWHLSVTNTDALHIVTSQAAKYLVIASVIAVC